MSISFQYDEVTASERLEEFTREKIDKLMERYDFIVRADVFFRKENTSSPDTGMICNIRLSVPGPRLFSEESTGEFQKSVSIVIDELERQLRKKKEKMKTY